MLKKLRVAASILAVSAVFLMPTAYAEQADSKPAQAEENCIKDVIEFVFGSDADNVLVKVNPFRKNGFEAKDGILRHYTNGQLDVYPQGFVQIEDGIYHVSEEGSVIDPYQAGFVTVDGVLCHVSVTGGPFDVYSAGFVSIDGKLYHVAQDGYAIDQYEKGLKEIDGGMYYVADDGSFLTNGAVGHLTFDENGRYTSGNATLDAYVDQALAECTNADMTKAQKLRAAYLYVRDHGAYLARPHQARGTTDWAEESALFMFEHKKGNCYCFAGQFLYLARRLGYDAYVVSGGVGHKNSDHAWVMIHENGTPYIYDVELEWGYRVGKYGHAEYNLYKMPLNKTVFSYQFP